MAVTDDRKFTRDFVYNLLEAVKGKTLGEVDKSHQFARTINSGKITGIAGDVIEQSVFGYNRDSDQECDIEIDGVLTELKTSGVRIPKRNLSHAAGKTGEEYNIHFQAKEGISITGVTFEPTIQTDFDTSHFWEKAEHLLIVIYEYKSYEVVPAAGYAEFPIIDYIFNTFSPNEKSQLQSDWEIVRDYLKKIYTAYPDQSTRNAQLVGFTHILRPNLLLIELVPGFKRKKSGSYQKPRYRLKKTFVDYIIRGHFDKSRTANEIALKESFSSFAELDARCHVLTLKHRGKSIAELRETFGIASGAKDIASKCVIRMFGTDCSKLNQISDFTKAGIIAKTITVTPCGGRTEDMKLKHVDFQEWADRDVDFEDSDVYNYFCEHSFLCPVFCEHDPNDPDKTVFEGFKRFAFDEAFIDNEVRRTWMDSRRLIHSDKLEWEYVYDKNGTRRENRSGSYMGAPNLPKSSEYVVFFRGGADVSTEKTRTEYVNGIRMLPQFIWLKGSFIAKKLQEIPFI